MVSVLTLVGTLAAQFRTTFARIEDLLAGVEGLNLTVHGYESVRSINVFLDANPGAAEVFSKGLPAPGPPISTHKHRQPDRQVPGRLRAVRVRVHDPVQEVLRRGEEGAVA